LSFVFDDLGDGYAVCDACNVLVGQFVRDHVSERIQVYPFEVNVRCDVGLTEWGVLHDVKVAELFAAAERRTKGRADRAEGGAGLFTDDLRSSGRDEDANSTLSPSRLTSQGPARGSRAPVRAESRAGADSGARRPLDFPRGEWT
jgi:hypothetical protein